MENNCECKDFDEREDNFAKSLKIFNVIASSNIINDRNGLKVDHTKILKCRNCNSYYIWNAHNAEYYGNDKISMKKYYPQTDDDGLRQILENIEGIVDEKMLDENSQLLNKLRKVKIPIDIVLDSNENKN